MKFSQIIAIIITPIPVICSPISPSTVIENGVAKLVTNLLPVVLEKIEQFGPMDFEDILGNIGLVSLPYRESAVERKKRDIHEEMNQVTDVITTLCNGAIGFARYANFDDVVQMLLNINSGIMGEVV